VTDLPHGGRSTNHDQTAHPPGKRRWHDWLSPNAFITFVAVCSLLFIVLDDIDITAQRWYSALLVAAGFLVWLRKGQEPHRIALFLLSSIASIRYIFWRGAHTLNLQNFLDAFISLALYGAEVYVVVILLLNFFQVLYLDQRPSQGNSDDAFTPTVDIFIPTYNESPEILRRTACGAKGINYINKKVYLLDDGRRADVKRLAEELGLNYITRPDNRHAKAGNINHALTKTKGEFILMFDADHIPVGSFLEHTIHLFKDPKVGLVQTPHRFVNPAPVERNLYLDGKLPQEQELFYQLVQVGNQRWDAAFFCGSAAILRRSALEGIGGIATQTVTEDCHTSMKLHGDGWKSMFVSTPLSVGLSPEDFRAHIIQRCRWARGMVQILRLDNPLFHAGLSWQQRICYFSSMVHFLFGVPRLIFIVAPLAYLIFGLHPFLAEPSDVIVLLVPHLMLAALSSNYQYRNIRHSFWSEIYETVLAPYLACVTIVGLVNPGAGTFEVTPKGGVIARPTYNFRLAWPLLVAFAATAIGLAICPLRWCQSHDWLEREVVLINAFWMYCNFFLVLTAALVALERPFTRRAHRVLKQVAMSIALDKKDTQQGRTVDINEFGALVKLPSALNGHKFEIGEKLHCAFPRPYSSGIELKVDAIVRNIKTIASKEILLGVEFTNLSNDKSTSLIQLSYSNQETWGEFREPPDSLIYSYWNLVSSPWRVFWRTFKYYRKLKKKVII
jgi:cellulose synthase (UDP-forming)